MANIPKSLPHRGGSIKILNLLCIWTLVSTLVSGFQTSAASWVTSSYFRAARQGVITSRTGNTSTPTYTFTFSSPFSGQPKLAYGVKKYMGNDYMSPEQFGVRRLTLNSSNFRVQVQIYGFTNVNYLSVAYLAAQPTFPHHLNSFDDVPINWGTTLSNITVNSSTATRYTNTINYTDQASSYTYKTFTSPLSSNKIMLFMTTMFAHCWYDYSFPFTDIYPVQFTWTATVVNTSSYTLRADVFKNCQMTDIRFSEIIFNYDDVVASGAYQLVFSLYSTTTVGGFVSVPAAFASNFIMGLVDFFMRDGKCTIIYDWNFVTEGGVHGVRTVQAQTGTGNCGMQSIRSNIFYIKTWSCPTGYPYFNLTSNVCQDLCTPGMYLTVNNTCATCTQYSCLNGCNSSSTCSSCSAADNRQLSGNNCVCKAGYRQNVTQNRVCISCTADIPDCSQCNLNVTNVLCSACSGGKLLISNACYPPCSPGQYRDSGTLLCVACTLYTCSAFCNSSNSCGSCDAADNRYLSGPNCVCNSGYTENSTQNSVCLNCASLISYCASCTTSGAQYTCSQCQNPRYLRISDNSCVTNCGVGFFQNNSGAVWICTACTYYACVDCNGTNSCASCDSATNHRQISGSTCVCQAGYHQNLVQNAVCVSCSATISNCARCTAYSANSSVVCDVCAVGYDLLSNSCAPVCTAGQYRDTNTLLCAACVQFACLNSCNSSTACASCDSATNHRTLSVAACVCQPGYHQNLVQNAVCLSCSATLSNCVTCHTVTGNSTYQCDTCGNSHYLQLGACVSSCSLGLYENNSSRECDTCTYYTCADCNSSNTCQTCDLANDHRQLIGGDCVCVPGFHQNLLQNRVCEQCNITISNCGACSSDLGNALVNCDVCESGFFLMNNACVSDCGIGYFGNASTAVCDQCTLYTCLDCSDQLTCNLCDLANHHRQINGANCSCVAGYHENLLQNSVCQLCSTTIADCDTCTTDFGNGNVNCDSCQPTYYLHQSTCIGICPIGYWQNNSTYQCVQCLDYTCFDCQSDIACNSCDDANTHRSLSGPQCLCSFGYHQSLSLFTVCLRCLDTMANCLNCEADFPGNHYTCLQCDAGYYLHNNSCILICPSGYLQNTVGFWTCVPCATYNCIDCSSTTTCASCDLANDHRQLIVDNCTCIDGFHENWVQSRSCLNCSETLQGCTRCHTDAVQSKYVCDRCELPYIPMNNGTCSKSSCITDPIDTSNHELRVVDIIKNPSSNIVRIEFRILPSLTLIVLPQRYEINYTDTISLQQAHLIDQTTLNTTYDAGKDILTAQFVYSTDIHGLPLSFSLSLMFQALINNQICVTAVNLDKTVEILPSNNLAAVLYSEQILQEQKKIEGTLIFYQSASYAALAVGFLTSGKIVGLELFGVLQLAFFALADYNYISPLLEPLASMNHFNGFNSKGTSGSRNQISNSSSNNISRLLTNSESHISDANASFSDSIPGRVQSINYDAQFLNNCNIMIYVMIVVLVIGLFLYFLGVFTRILNKKVRTIGVRILKQVLITLLIFNLFNISFSSAIHFAYAKVQEDTTLYVLGSIIIIFLLLLILAFVALINIDYHRSKAYHQNARGFGEFLDKFKPTFEAQNYICITILYRIAVTAYIALNTENQIATLIILLFSIFFIMYNLIHLPFKEAHHNYRANLCHITQLIILFVTMYYRSMRANDPVTQTLSIFHPIYIQLVAIGICLFVSLLCIIYDAIIWVKRCCSGNYNVSSQQKLSNEDGLSKMASQNGIEVTGQNMNDDTFQAKGNFIWNEK